MLRTLFLSLATLIMLLSSIWAVLALWYQAPGAMLGRLLFCGLWLLGMAGCVYWLWAGQSAWQASRSRVKLAAAAASVVIALTPCTWS